MMQLLIELAPLVSQKAYKSDIISLLNRLRGD